MQLNLTSIKFPEIELATRDAHKLRGYFGNLFKEHSTILHNHLETGENNYKYPLVQYKVLDNVPYLVGVNEGGKLLTELFLKIKEINIDGYNFPVFHKNIENRIIEIFVDENLHNYNFATLWLGLNQENHRKYLILRNSDKQQFFYKIITGNILSFYKTVGYFAEEKIMLIADLKEKETKFKDKTMLAFSGSFTTNAVLPDYIGLGKSVSRGFGTIKQMV